jgi:hypothetical protein
MIKTFEQFCAIYEEYNRNINKQDVAKLISKLQPNISELIELIKEQFHKYIDGNYKDTNKNISFEINLDDEIYKISLKFDVKMLNRKNNNKIYYDLGFKISKFSIYSESDDIEISNDMFDITEETYSDLFEIYKVSNVDEKTVEKYLYCR